MALNPIAPFPCDGDPEGLLAVDVPPAPESGSRKLWLAVLEDLFFVRDCRGKEATKQQAYDRAWLLSPREDRCSFLWLCSHLGLDPVPVRAAYFHRLSGAPCETEQPPG